MGEGGGEQLEGVFHVHGAPWGEQLQRLAHLPRLVPLDTLEELGQSLYTTTTNIWRSWQNGSFAK